MFYNQEVKTLIGKGDTFGAINLLFENERSLFRDHSNEIIVIRGQYIKNRYDLRKGIISRDQFILLTNQINYRIFDLLQDISKSDIKGQSEASGVTFNPYREVLFNQKEIIIVLYETDLPYDVIFRTDYFRNRLFIKGERQQKISIFNILSYRKKFSFQIKKDQESIDYFLDIRFSMKTGLMSNYMLVRKDRILLQSNL